METLRESIGSRHGLVAFGLVWMLAAGCGEPESGEDPTVGCRLNSDCVVGQVCQGGQCVDDEASCEGDDCPCVRDADCGAGRACDLETGECFGLECLGDNDCALGEVCEGGLCLNDVAADRDRDGVPDAEDLCPEIENADQEDNEGDGAGDACDDDDDNDAVPDSVDNCPLDANTAQADANGDGVGNACDPEVAGTTIIGQVDFSAGGAPNIAFAQVFISAQESPAPIDAEGNFIFEEVMATGGSFTIRVVWPGFDLFRATYEAPGDVEVYEATNIVLTPAPASMTGRARLQSQENHGDIRVQAFVGDALVSESRTDEAGFFVLAASQTNYDLRFTKQTYLPETLAVSWNTETERFEVNAEGLSEFEGVELRPNLNGALTGSLTSPIPNLDWPLVATVSLTGAGGRQQEAVQIDGSFQFDPLQPDLYLLEVSVQGHRPQAVSLRVDAGDTELDPLALELALTQAMRGSVRLEGRQAHGGVLVQASIEGTPVSSTVTDPEGRFELFTASLDHRLAFSRDSFLPQSAEVVWDRDGARFEIDGEAIEALDPATSLTPDRSASLQGLVRTPTGLPEIAALRLVGEFETLLGTVQPGGAFQIQDVQPGLYVLEVRAAGHLTETRVVSMRQNASEDIGLIDLRLESDDEDQAVVMSGRAHLGGRQSHAGILVEARIGGALVDSAITGEEGEFAFQAARIDYTLTFDSGGFLAPVPVEVVWDDEESRFEVDGVAIGQLDPVSTLIPDQSAGVRGVMASPLGDLDWPTQSVISIVGEHTARQVSPLNNGAFIIDNLQPGLYGLQFEVRGHQPLSMEVVLESQTETDVGQIEVSLALVEALEGSVRLTGRDEHGGIVVQATIGDTPLTTVATNSDGNYTFMTSRLDHTLTFSRDNFTPHSAEVSWDANEDRYEIDGQPLDQVVIALEPSRDANLAGSLQSPIEGVVWPQIAQVTLTGQNERRQEGVLPDGSFTFDLLQPGLYVLEVSAQGHLPATQAVSVASGNNPLPTIALIPEFEEPEEAVTMRGRARLEGRQNHLGIVVQAFIGQALVASSVTDEQGQFALSASRLDYRLRFLHEGFDPAEVQASWSQVRERFEVNALPLDGIDDTFLARINGQITVSVDIEPNWIPQAQRTVRVRVVGEGRELSNENVGDGAPVAFPGLASGTYVVFAERQGFTLDQALVKIDEEDNNPEADLAVSLVDLASAGLDLRGVSLSAGDLSDINLRGANLSGVTLRNQNLSNLDLTGANLTNADLSGIDLRCARLDEANLFGANLAGAILFDTSMRFAALSSANLTDALFSDVDGPFVCNVGNNPPNPQQQALFTGAVFTQALLTRADLRGVDLQGADMNYSTLQEADLEGASLGGVTMILANLSDADIRSADLSGAVLLNAIFTGTDARDATLDDARLNSAIIEGANFQRASMQRTNFNGATVAQTFFEDADATDASFLGVIFDGEQNTEGELAGVTFDGAEMVGTLFNNVDMGGATFTGADLRSATFVSCDFEDTALTGADLTAASLIGADLQGVDLSDAILSFTNLASALTARSDIDRVVWQGTTCPDGSNSDAGGNTCLGHLYAGAECDIQPGTSCVAADLSGADLRGANLEGAQLESADMSDADLRGANFNGVTFGGQIGANLNDTLVEGASFVGANMLRVGFVRAEGARVNFAHADLNAVGFFDASMPGANLSGANLFSNTVGEIEATFPGLIHDGDTVFPNGIDLQSINAKALDDGFEAIMGSFFVMGSPGRELGHRSDETPQYTAVLSRTFFMQATEVTQDQWETLMGNNPSALPQDDSVPVNGLNWYESLAYCNALSQAEGLAACYDLSGCTGTPGGGDFTCPDDIVFELDCPGYRLPTEAEWEYAYRAGTRTAFYKGEITEPNGVDPILDQIGFYFQNSNNNTFQRVAQKLPNGWGLYDMAGNAFEWVFDWENSDYLTRNFALDPVAIEKPSEFATHRMIRGGNIFSPAQNCRGAFRDSNNADTGGNGFRVVRTVE